MIFISKCLRNISFNFGRNLFINQSIHSDPKAPSPIILQGINFSALFIEFGEEQNNLKSVYIYRQIDRSCQAGDIVNRCVIGTNKAYRDSFICCLNDLTIPTKIHHRINYWLIYTT